MIYAVKYKYLMYLLHGLEKIFFCKTWRAVPNDNYGSFIYNKSSHFFINKLWLSTNILMNSGGILQ